MAARNTWEGSSGRDGGDRGKDAIAARGKAITRLKRRIEKEEGEAGGGAATPFGRDFLPGTFSCSCVAKSTG